MRKGYRDLLDPNDPHWPRVRPLHAYLWLQGGDNPIRAPMPVRVAGVAEIQGILDSRVGPSPETEMPYKRRPWPPVGIGPSSARITAWGGSISRGRN